MRVHEFQSELWLPLPPGDWESKVDFYCANPLNPALTISQKAAAPGFEPRCGRTVVP
jgi:hypothetical protein